MRKAAKQVLLPALAMLLAALLLLAGTGAVLSGTMPPYNSEAGNDCYTEKITGQYLVQEAAKTGDTLFLFGSSELRTTEVSTHPANFFAGKRAGFQVNLIGRGSCQSLIHAIQIAASGDCLAGQKVVLITSPQSYLPEGIAPDLFAANFSPQQYLALLEDDSLTPELKQALSARVAELLEEYAALPDAVSLDPAVALLARHQAAPTALSGAETFVLGPYYRLSRYLWEMQDKMAARRLLNSLPPEMAPVLPGEIDWQEEEAAALAAAREMTGNNTFGILDGYYTTYIGSRLERQKDRDKDLSYTQSREYGDLRLLFEVCRQKDIEPLFIHVPLHGQWSDYTGFSAGRRQEYYGNVRQIAGEYQVEMLDLTGNEYDEYFMCDVMHLGWKGWLAVDKALIDYYYSG